MGISVGDVFVDVRPDFSKFSAQMQAGLVPAQRAVAAQTGATVTREMSGLKAKLLGIGQGVGGLVAGAAVGTAVLGFVHSAIDEAEEAQRVARQTDAVLRSTGGVAGVTADHVSDLATKLSQVAAVDDEVIAQGENVLLTFTKIKNAAGEGNDIFDQATKVALDLSAALGTSLQGSIIQVGKALNDPVKGISALTRVGVSFTQEQKDMVAQLVETGDTLAAQKVILEELKREFGGAAAANATATERMKVAFGNIAESIGTVLLPVLDHLSEILQALVPVFQFVADHAGQLITVFLAYKGIPLILRGVDAALKVLIGDTAILSGEMGTLATTSGAAAGAITAEGNAAVVASGKNKTFFDGLVAAAKGPLPYVLALIQGIQDLKAAVAVGGGSDVDRIAEGIRAGTVEAKELSALLDSLRGKINQTIAPTGTADKLNELLKGLGVDTGRFGLNAEAAFNLLNEGLDRYRQNIKDARYETQLAAREDITFGRATEFVDDMEAFNAQMREAAHTADMLRRSGTGSFRSMQEAVDALTQSEVENAGRAQQAATAQEMWIRHMRVARRVTKFVNAELQEGKGAYAGIRTAVSHTGDVIATWAGLTRRQVHKWATAVSLDAQGAINAFAGFNKVTAESAANAVKNAEQQVGAAKQYREGATDIINSDYPAKIKAQIIAAGPDIVRQWAEMTDGQREQFVKALEATTRIMNQTKNIIISKIQEAMDEVEKATSKTIELHTDVDTSAAEKNLAAWLQKVQNTKVSIPVDVLFATTGGSTDTDANNHATGARIPGHGGGDIVPAMLEPGEWVIRKEAVSHYGDDMMSRINRREFAVGGPVWPELPKWPLPVRGFARGGDVGADGVVTYTLAADDLKTAVVGAAKQAIKELFPDGMAPGGLTAKAQEYYGAIQALFHPPIMSTGPSVRKIIGTNTWSQHAYGNALDITNSFASGPDDYKATIANWLAEMGRLRKDIHYIAYNNRGWTPSSPWTAGVTSPHTNHVHADFYPQWGGTPPGHPVGRARGGEVMPGTPYLVGEEGPELLLPGRHARVAPGIKVDVAITGGTLKLHRDSRVVLEDISAEVATRVMDYRDDRRRR